MLNRAKTTNDEGEILQWATRQNAHPVQRAPYLEDGEPAMLGFVFGDPPVARENLHPISWPRFFAVFHLVGLVLVYDSGPNYELLKIEEKTSTRFEGKPMQA